MMENLELETPYQDEALSNKKKCSNKGNNNKDKKSPTKVQKIAKNIATKTLLFVVIMLFIVGFGALFGQANILMGVCIATALLMFLRGDIGIKNTQAPFVIFGLFILVGLATFVATLNPWLGAAVNLISVFLIMVLSGQQVEYRTFLPYMLCYIFAQSSPVQGAAFGMRMASLAAGGALVGLVYFIIHLKKPSPQNGILTVFKESLTNLSSTKTRFFFRMAFGMAIGMFIGDIIGSNRTLWFGATVLSLTQPLTKDTAERTVYRLFATFFGGLIYVTVFDYIIPPEFFSLGLMAAGYLYTYATKYQYQQVFVVISALGSAHMLGIESFLSWEMRLGFVAIGAAIVIVLNIIDKFNLLEKLERVLFKNKASVSPLESK